MLIKYSYWTCGFWLENKDCSIFNQFGFPLGQFDTNCSKK